MTGVEILLFIVGIVLVAGIALAAMTAWPLLRLIQEREAVERERRLAEWRLQAATAHAMQEMLQQSRTTQ